MEKERERERESYLEGVGFGGGGSFVFWPAGTSPLLLARPRKSTQWSQHSLIIRTTKLPAPFKIFQEVFSPKIELKTRRALLSEPHQSGYYGECQAALTDKACSVQGAPTPSTCHIKDLIKLDSFICTYRIDKRTVH